VTSPEELLSSKEICDLTEYYMDEKYTPIEERSGYIFTVLGSIANKLGITTENAWISNPPYNTFHAALYAPYLNGIDTWDNIDETTIISSETIMADHKFKASGSDPNILV
jgi:hypothetical protein